MAVSFRSIRIRLDRTPDRSYHVAFAELGDIPSLLTEHGIEAETCLVVTDTNVAAHYGAKLSSSLENAGREVLKIVVTPGENSKSIESYAEVLDGALERPIDRATPVLALGGGVVGDLAGFAAATLLRGLPLVQIPTSLVAQVDSAIGGKTGINHSTGKNLVGSFYQPRLVVVDTSVLETLPDAEWMDGLSEVVKYGLIADASFARSLLDDWTNVIGRDSDVVRVMIRRCVEIKAEIVSEDESERGVRAILNFGHTFGHALERIAGYGGLTHGQGVALGMRAALYLSSVLYPDVDFKSAWDLVEKLPAVRVTAGIEELRAAMESDKKRVGAGLRFVALRETGRATVVDGVREDLIRDSWQHALGRDR